MALWLVALGALPGPLSIQLEEIADVPADLEVSLLEDLRLVVSAERQSEATVRDCRLGGCKPRDAAAEEEVLHLLVFGGPTRISIAAERLGRGRALRASVFVPIDAPDRRALLKAWAQELFPEATGPTVAAQPELLQISKVETSDEGSGARTVTVISLIVGGAALAGAITFAVLAHTSQNELSAKQVYDDEVPGLDASIRRDGSIALGLLGGALGAGLVAVIAEATR